ncbi:hypothetical protein MLD38_020849 [Melastoma candidum]|uniref:Uncharacterized protein n=1 Tax=Melastoma candidum TaxID=119954 RepID=A0ACB9QI15_9MYRT|nr:hypothetical protein MLD38_020849 [Melastoma candidum]
MGKTLEWVYILILRGQVLKNIEEAPFKVNVGLSILHAILVPGDQTNFKIEEPSGMEASRCTRMSSTSRSTDTSVRLSETRICDGSDDDGSRIVVMSEVRTLYVYP